MPERWQQEVKKLGEVEPSDDVERRAQQGPREPAGPSLPPRRQRIVAGIVAMVVFLAAGGFAWRALRPGDAQVAGDPQPGRSTVVATFEVFHGEGGVSGPSATLSTASGVIDGVATSYQWTNSVASGNFDMFGPPITAKDKFVHVTVGSDLVVVSDASGVTGSLETLRGAAGNGATPPLFQYEPVTSYGPITDPVKLDAPLGRYILHLTPTWDEGEVNYYFPIELIAPPDSGSSQPTLTTVGKNAPEATLAFEGDSERGVRAKYTWCEASGNCVSGIADFSTHAPVERYLQIPAGTAIELRGDATSASGEFSLLMDHGGGSVSYGNGQVPDVPGRYILKLDVTFDRGSATFFFGVDALSTVLSPSPGP